MSFQCLACSVRQVEAVLGRMDLPDGRKLECMRQVLFLLSKAPPGITPPAAARDFYALLRELTGIDDPYREIKAESNRRVRAIYEKVSAAVRGSEDPLLASLCAAAAGNIIDYGAMTAGVCDDEILASVEQALEDGVDRRFYEAFRASLERSRTILYLADNAGEIVFDRLLVERLPREKVLFAVRGGPIINDATREDAESAGITGLVKVIDTGDALPGIDLSTASAGFVSAFRGADMVISKGQGNLETLWDMPPVDYREAGADVFFVLKIKCGVVAAMLGKSTGETAFIHKRTGTAAGRPGSS